MVFINSLGNQIKTLISNILSWNWILFGTHIGASLLIIVIIIWWFWKPTNDFIDRYKQTLQKTHQELTLSNRESSRTLKLLRQEQENLISLRETAIIEGKKEAHVIVENAKFEAKQEALIIIDTAIAKAKQLEETAHILIKNSVVQLSIDLTKKLVDANITQENNQKIIDHYIEEVESKSVTDPYKI